VKLPAGIVVVAGLLLACGSTAWGAHRVADGYRCQDASEFLFCVNRAQPRAGRLFVGLSLKVYDPAATQVSHVDCVANWGSKVVDTPSGGPRFNGEPLDPIIRLFFAAPDANGRRWISRLTCGWRIPRAARGKLVSLLPPSGLFCDTSCPPLGLDITYGGGSSETTFHETTWRVHR
jgi:hypothetical protein